jgi:LppP/LprE lipoprotein
MHAFNKMKSDLLLAKRAQMTVVLAALVLFALHDASAQPAAPRASWLDRPPTAWNRPDGIVPKAPVIDRTRAEVLSECSLALRRTTVAERALVEAGWIPFLLQGQTRIAGDVELIGGMADADGMCRPSSFNVFVFVNGRFAGSLSPGLMNARDDGSILDATIASAASITASFSRYTAKDPLCCPSSTAAVRYRINRSGAQASVEVQDVRPGPKP